jgi:hypothetical protein
VVTVAALLFLLAGVLLVTVLGLVATVGALQVTRVDAPRRVRPHAEWVRWAVAFEDRVFARLRTSRPAVALTDFRRTRSV